MLFLLIYYYFIIKLPKFCILEITPDIANKLPPTDTRFRPDQRLYEEVNYDFYTYILIN